MPTLRTRATARFCAFAVPAVLAAAAITTISARAAAEEPPKTAPTGAANEKPALIPADAAPGVDPAKDKASLEKQGDARPKADGSTADPTSGPVYSDSWWSSTRPIVEIHGFFRTRGEIFHNFSLGRIDPIGSDESYLFPRPSDDTWTDRNGNKHQTLGCGSGTGTAAAAGECTNKTNATANMRFRIDPEIHISDNLRIMSQIDLLDNLVLGSTPEGYTNGPAGGTSTNGSTVGWASTGRGGYVPLKAFSSTQVTPVAGINSLNNSVSVKRVWGEYMTPVGQIRFGRMPSHWGLGILANAGDYIDADYQSTADRIMFITGIKRYDLYVVGSWDFPGSGKTSQILGDQQGQAYNVSQLENVSQWVLAVARRVRPDEIAKRLARGEIVVNGGLYAVYRQQILANESVSNSLNVNYPDYASAYHDKLIRVGAKAFIPDVWLQVLAKNFRWETEAVYIHGSIENPRTIDAGTYTPDNYQIRQFGYATELEYKALNDDLKLRFSHGFATGDGSVSSLGTAGPYAFTPQLLGNTDSTFRFNPAYRVDLILFREILTRVEGAYYFKPGIEYDFSRALDGEKFGGRAEVIWSRASKPIQSPGHQADLGVEVDLSLYYQSKDGSLNDDPTKLGGFYAMLQYGVLFPLGGLGYLPKDVDPVSGTKPEISTAQTVRLFLGIAY
jgi:uncharacterized protein (TIGR04551 family)